MNTSPPCRNRLPWAASVLVVAALLSLTELASASITTSLEIPGIQGQGPGGSIVVLSFEFSFPLGQSRQLQVTKQIDTASPQLFQLVATGNHLPNMTMTVASPGGSVIYTFTDVVISADSQSGAVGGVPTESLTFNFVSYTQATASLDDITAALEQPSNGEAASGIGLIQGWAFSKTGTIVSPIQVSIDGMPSINVPCCSSRADVAQTYPKAPIDSGFAGVFNWDLLASGMHTIVLNLQSSTGGTAVLNRTFVTARLSDQLTFLQNFAWATDATSYCTTENATSDDPSLPPVRAALQCTGAVLTGKSGEDVCDGTFTLLWSTALQGFKLISTCQTSTSQKCTSPWSLACNKKD